MTNEQYQAKNWLMRIPDYAAKVDAERRTLEMLQSRLYRGVANYDNYTGRKDPMTARAAHEDALIEVSMQAERVEKAQKEYIAELNTTRATLEALPAHLKALAIDRYLNGIKWDKLEKIYPYCRSELYRQNIDILEHVAQILKAEQTPLIITPDKKQEAAAV